MIWFSMYDFKSNFMYGYKPTQNKYRTILAFASKAATVC